MKDIVHIDFRKTTKEQQKQHSDEHIHIHNIIKSRILRFYRKKQKFHVTLDVVFPSIRQNQNFNNQKSH